ncbi:MAG: hypothetical protein Q8R40_01905 [bacterium]|nr:hypothetical protein [bacterium]
MLDANLIPEEQKKIIASEQWLRVVRFFGIGAITILIIGIALLAPSYLPLYFQSRELKRDLDIRQEGGKKINADEIVAVVSKVQSIIGSLRQSAVNPAGALGIFDLLTANQQGVNISAFNIDKLGNLYITGHANTRADLLAFEQRLRDSSRFQDITSPLANMIQETDITFNFKGTLKSNYAL